MNDRRLLTSFFVYGTLRRGQVRQRSWPRQPLSVEPAWTLGQLYDLGPYPALVEGPDRVLGELWRFASEDIEVTLRALDRIEGFQNSPRDLYRRVVVQCRTEAGELLAAHVYRYARPLPDLAKLVAANAAGFCQWP